MISVKVQFICPLNLKTLRETGYVNKPFSQPVRQINE